MNDTEILKLKEIAKTKTIAWNPDKNTCYIVARIGNPRSNNPECDDYEPSECAYFEKGEYVALYNCSLNDFSIIQKI